ncbi:MAG: hypothetical protein PHS17_04540, partial [Desulfobacterales bacterium]|nr:hypothetical protein [Desulfobacterales bacterium]
MAKPIAMTATGFCVAMSLFHLYTGCFGSLDPWSQRTVHLTLGFIITFLLYPSVKGKKISLGEIGLAVVSLMTGLYIIVNMDAIVDRAGLPSTWDVVF